VGCARLTAWPAVITWTAIPALFVNDGGAAVQPVLFGAARQVAGLGRTAEHPDTLAFATHVASVGNTSVQPMIFVYAVHCTIVGTT
jgi:hypothetical protein